MASTNFTKIAEHIANARVNFTTGTFKALLVSAAPSESDLDTWDYRNDVTSEIAASGGYSAGGFAVTASVAAIDTTNNRIAITYTCAAPTYSGATLTAVGCFIYLSTGTNTTDCLLHWVDFGGSVVSTAGDFTVTFSTPFYINR